MKKEFKKSDLKKEADNLRYFGDIDVTTYPSPEQLSIVKELNFHYASKDCCFYIDGKTVIVKLGKGLYVAYRRKPVTKSKLVPEECMLIWDKYEFKRVWKINTRNY